jgi:ATP-dependent DNA ligase
MTAAVFGRPAFPSGFVAPCLPTSATEAPSGALWVHEIKHDGFRVIASRTASRSGYTAGRAMI